MTITEVWLLAMIAGFSLLAGCSRPTANTPTPTPTPTPTHAEMTSTWTAAMEGDGWKFNKAASGSAWQYYTKQDEMGRGETRAATVFSSNTVDFGWSGAQPAALTIIKWQWVGSQIRLITAGQITTGSYGKEKQIAVRFDDGPIEYFPLLEADNSLGSGVAVIGNKPEFAGRLLKTKTVKLEAIFFQAGARVFSFDVHGLDLSQIEAETGR